MNDYGKTSKRLARLGAQVAEARQHERQVGLERRGLQRELEQARGRRDDAALAAEAAVIDGQPVPDSKQLREAAAEVEKLEGGLDPVRWTAREKAARQAIGRRDSERERFAVEHRDALLAELASADEAETEAMRAALAAVLEQLRRRQQVAADLDVVLRHLPSPYAAAGAIYPPQTRQHRDESVIPGTVRDWLAHLVPAMPGELLAGDAQAGPEPVAAGGRVVGGGFEGDAEGDPE